MAGRQYWRESFLFNLVPYGAFSKNQKHEDARHRDGRAPPRPEKRKRPPGFETKPGGPEKKTGGALLSHAPGRSTIAAGALNVRVREGNGCDSPAKATGQKRRHRKRRKKRTKAAEGAQGRARTARRAMKVLVLRPRPRRAAAWRGAERASRTAYQNRSAETLAGLAHPACPPGRLPGAFSVLAHGEK